MAGDSARQAVRPAWLPTPRKGGWRELATEFRGEFAPRSWLYGWTGSGKTSRVRQLADELGYELVRVPLDGLPEDLVGLPRPRGGRFVWLPPDWAVRAAEQPCVLFLDELDKARRETRAALLTLLAERLVAGVQLHPQTIIVAASQPIDTADWDDEHSRALLSRLCCFPVTDDWTVVGERLGLTGLAQAIPHNLRRPAPKLVAPNELDPRRVEFACQAWLAGWDFIDHLFPEHIGQVLRRFLEDVEPDLASPALERRFVEAENLDEGLRSLIARMSPGHAATMLQQVIGRAVAAVVTALTERALTDPALSGEVQKAYCETPCRDARGERVFWRDEDGSEQARALRVLDLLEALLVAYARQQGIELPGEES